MNKIDSIVIKNISNHSDPGILITKKTNFQECCNNSISFVKIIVELEEEFQLEFDDNMLTCTKFKTVDDIIGYIKCKRMQKGMY